MEIALFHVLGRLPEPESTHRFCCEDYSICQMRRSPRRKERVGPYRLDVVWPAADDAVKLRVIEFWNRWQALPANSPEVGINRANELVLVAQTDDEIAAVSTVFRSQIDQLGFTCFHYRTFVAPEHRNLHVLSLDLFQASYVVLNERFQAKENQDVLGIYLELQNDGLNRHFKYAVWEAEGMNVVYIGKSPQGHHRRVWYFDGAMVP
jgi:hypothetical protein